MPIGDGAYETNEKHPMGGVFGIICDISYGQIRAFNILLGKADCLGESQ
jgi:hypothetical protein